MTIYRQSKTFIYAFSILLGVAAAGSAQMVEDYRFKGTVKDTEGNALGGAKITLRNVENGKKIVIKVNKKGKFDKRMIPHAIYDATFEKKGYLSQIKRLDWSIAGVKTITREADVTLIAEGEKERRENARAKDELGKKKGNLYRDAYAQLAKGECEAASKSASELIELGAGSFEAAARFVVARCHAMAGRNEASAAEYGRVVELKPDLFEGHFDLGNVLLALGQTEQAIAEYQRASELNPDHVDTNYNLGAIYFKQGNYAVARPWLDRVVTLDAGHAQAHKALGFVVLSAEDKDFALAKKHLDRYLELAPDAPAAEREQITAIVAGIK